jgi:hypothetical protein
LSSLETNGKPGNRRAGLVGGADRDPAHPALSDVVAGLEAEESPRGSNPRVGFSGQGCSRGVMPTDRGLLSSGLLWHGRLVRYDIEFGGHPQEVTVSVSGFATPSEFRQLYEELAGDPRFRPGMRILLDFRELDATRLDAWEARDIGRHLAGLESRYGSASLAVVVPDTVTFGLTRLAELSASFEQIEVLVRYTLEDALRWLETRPAVPE